jgi:hypothetical protein
MMTAYQTNVNQGSFQTQSTDEPFLPIVPFHVNYFQYEWSLPPWVISENADDTADTGL